MGSVLLHVLAGGDQTGLCRFVQVSTPQVHTRHKYSSMDRRVLQRWYMLTRRSLGVSVHRSSFWKEVDEESRQACDSVAASLMI